MRQPAANHPNRKREKQPVESLKNEVRCPVAEKRKRNKQERFVGRMIEHQGYVRLANNFVLQALLKFKIVKISTVPCANRISRRIERAKIRSPTECVWHAEDAARDLQDEEQPECSVQEWQCGRSHRSPDFPIEPWVVRHKSHRASTQRSSRKGSSRRDPGTSAALSSTVCRSRAVPLH